MLEAIWTGPYSWPTFEAENGLPSLPKHPGVYLWTVEYLDGYLIYAAGLTRRPIPVRTREHTRRYMCGDYNVLDIEAMRRGERQEIWHGWGWTHEKRNAFEKQKESIQDAAQRQLEGFRIFVADMGKVPRILERMEAAIMTTLYRQPSPFCDIPDKGMQLSSRWKSEDPILVENICEHALLALPDRFEI